MVDTSLVVIGAGPYGLAVAAYAEHQGIDTVVLADINAVPYLEELPDLETVDGFPVLDDHMQTSEPGLFLTGFAATRDFGPFFGFVRASPAAAEIIVPELARILLGRTTALVH
jgi:thioredoxin reductase